MAVYFVDARRYVHERDSAPIFRGAPSGVHERGLFLDPGSDRRVDPVWNRSRRRLLAVSAWIR